MQATLNLRHNDRLGVPTEILESYDPKRIFNVYFSQEDKLPLNEAKILVVGQPAVGKSTLIERLIDPGKRPQPGKSRTEGIDIFDWKLDADGGRVAAHVWDFAGQEIDHATHQFFFTRRSLYPRELLFGCNWRPDARQYYAHWDAISVVAKLRDEDTFTLKTLRATVASEAKRVRPGAAEMLLQHARRDVTGRHYLELSDVLRDVIDEMRMPTEFLHGVKLCENVERKERKKKIELHIRQYAAPANPKPDEWQFEDGAFCFRSRWYSISGAPGRVLKLLALSDKSVDVYTLADAIFTGHPDPPKDFRSRSGRVNSLISALRERLRRMLFVDDGWNPVPCVAKGNGGEWTLYFPSAIADQPAVLPNKIGPYQLMAARKKAGLSQRDLAELAGVSESAVSTWETGRANISHKNAAKMRRVLGKFLDNGKDEPQ